mgnify:CR=1 FL=1
MAKVKAKIKEYKELSLKSLSFSTGQTRTHDTGIGIEELALNIKTHGQIHPILVAPSAESKSKYEVIVGQRRVLAHQFPSFDKKTIMAGIYNRPLSEEEGKKISISENLARINPHSIDTKTTFQYFFDIYQNLKDVAKITGFPEAVVSQWSKRESLPKKLLALVDKKECSLQDAIDADTSVWGGDEKIEEKIELAKSFKKMNPQTKKTVKKVVKENPGITTHDAKKVAKKRTTYPLNLNLLEGFNKALVEYASGQEMDRIEAAEEILEEGLRSAGFGIEDE